MKFVASALAAAAVGVCTYAYPAAAQVLGNDTFVIQNQPQSAAAHTLTPRYAVLPYKGPSTAAEIDIQSSAATTIPLWSSSIKVGATTYKYRMVGKSPFVKQGVPATSVKTVIVPLIFTFRNSAHKVIGKSDPTKVDTKCSPKGSALKLVQNSPVFKNVTNFKVGNTLLGTGQYVSLFQRGEFWTKVKTLNPGYKVNLAPVVTTGAISIIVDNPDVFSGLPCGTIYGISINAFDSFVQGTLFTTLANRGFGPTTLPLFLTYNVVWTDNGCCILGYHSAFDNPHFGNHFQTYSVANYDSSRAFTGTSDISALTHEIGEWMNDPDGVNPTPPWGHTGQVSGCQNNLEVGDPLSGTIKPITLNGFTYHVQDMAFFSWFYQQPTSMGDNGWYSLYGTFKTKAKPCT
jgi:hypothetical protein